MEYHSTGSQSGVGGGGRETHLALSVINGIYCIFNVYGHWIKGCFPFQQGLQVIFHCGTSMGVLDPSYK